MRKFAAKIYWNYLKFRELLETAGEIASPDSDTEQASLAFICKRLKVNYRKLSEEERKWLKKIA